MWTRVALAEKSVFIFAIKEVKRQKKFWNALWGQKLSEMGWRLVFGAVESMRLRHDKK